MFNFEDFLLRAGQRLLREPPQGWNYSDDDMNERARMIAAEAPTRPAAVLVPIILRKDPMVVLTRRQDHLKKHGGQIAFPGGRQDAGETPLQAALREAQEEIGLDAKFVRPLGYADGFLTITHYVVTPVVALVDPASTFQAQEDEVAEIFEVPLSFLMDDANCQVQNAIARGMVRHFYVYPFGERYIWGATAGMIRNIHGRLYS